MKLSEYKNEQALEILADLIEPASEIFSDQKFLKQIQKKNIKKAEIAKALIKDHKSAIIQILAILDGVPVDEYECNIFSLPMKLIEVLNDKELVDFFTSQVQIADGILPTQP